MNAKIYMEDRVNNQLKYFSRKSAWNQKRYRIFKLITIVAAVLIPLVSVTPCEEVSFPFAGALGVIVALSQGVLSLYKFQDNWVEYRITNQQLKQEKHLFLTNSSFYKGKNEENAFGLFVERIEDILAKESRQWKINAQKEEKTTDKN